MQVSTEILSRLTAMVTSQDTDIIDTCADEEGWHIMGLDPSHTSMMSMEIKAGAFTDYRPMPDLILSASRLDSALKNMGKTVDIAVEGGRCILRSEGMTSKLPLLTHAEVSRRFPTFESEANADVSVDVIKRVLKSADVKVDQICFEISGGKLTLIAEDDEGLGNTIVVEDEEEIIANGEAKAFYPLSNLRDGIGAIPRGEVVSLEMTTDYPLTISWEGNNWSARYLIAPRINEE